VYRHYLCVRRDRCSVHVFLCVLHACELHVRECVWDWLVFVGRLRSRTFFWGACVFVYVHVPFGVIFTEQKCSHAAEFG
jgi:hypothetical protein